MRRPHDTRYDASFLLWGRLVWALGAIGWRARPFGLRFEALRYRVIIVQRPVVLLPWWGRGRG